jgi:hypothetical protein
MSHAKQLPTRRYLNDSLEISNRERCPGHIKTDRCRKGPDTVSATVQHRIEAALAEERRAYLGWSAMPISPGGAHPQGPAVGALSGHCSRSTAP